MRTAAGTAYNGVLLSLDAYLLLKNVKIPKAREKSIEWYRKVIGKQDRKLLKQLNGVYDGLHLAGYYDGSLLVGNMTDGLATDDDIITRLKP